jgi:tripartite-type tricarboxylate transporter receptor subunit TctC
MIRRTLLLLAALAATDFSFVSAQAADWRPASPVRIVVGFGAGGGTDIAARIVADPLGELLGQSVVVENRPGAGGITAANYVAKSPKDGTTALMMSNAHVIAPAMYKSLPYDSVNDFQMLSMIGSAGLVLVARKDFPANNLDETLRMLKASPNKYNFATPGVGTTQHFAVELMNQMAGIKITHVPYRSTPAVITGLLSKDIHYAFELIQVVSGQIQAKTLKAIAVTSPARYPSLPEVPTFAESGLPGYDVTSWYGLAMAPDTPRPIVDKLNKAVAEALNRPAIRKQISDIGAQPKTSTPEELSRHIAAEVAKWQGVREKAGIPQL